MGFPDRVLGESISTRSEAYRELFAEQLDTTLLTNIRQATNQSMALGNEQFKREVERLSGRRVTPLKRGPGTK